MNFIFRCGLWMPSQPEKQPEADLDAFLKSWLGSPAPITILDLSSVPESVLDTVIGSSVRLIFDALYWARDDPEGGRRRPMLLVLEEAHRYLKRDGGGRAMQVVQKVVREGRKYGVGMMAVSQRPSELDPTVLSQCGTLVAMRLTNTSDQGAISSAASDTAGGLVSLLPVLRTGEAIMIGEAASLPLRIRVDQPPTERRPRSDDPLVFDTRPDFGWNQASPESRDYVPVVKNWRKNAQ
jgi:DNA helicase HerA-like ATPase